MAATNFKPAFSVCKTESDAFTACLRLPGNQGKHAPVNVLPRKR